MPADPAAIVLAKPASQPHEGLPIGNGRMGTLVWTTPTALELQINRVDVFAVNRNADSHHFSRGETTNDYCSACARVRIEFGDECLAAGPDFRQALSLAAARCTVAGSGVRAECWVAAADDALVAIVTDERETPRPIDIILSMWRAPEVRRGAHTASYAFAQTAARASVVQTFTERDHYCSSAVAVACPDANGEVIADGATTRVLRLPATRGTRTVLISSAASWTRDGAAGKTADDLLTALAPPEALAAASERHAHWWRAFWSRTHIDVKSPDGTGEQAARDRQIFLYHLASSSRGAYPPKWNGSIFVGQGDERGWGSQFWLWTMEMLYWPLHAADASDLAVPFFDLYRNALPAMQIAARQRWDAAGFFLPETMPFDGPTELPDTLVEAYRERFLRDPGGAALSPQLVAHCKYDWHLEASTSRREGTELGYSWIGHLASSGAELAVHSWWHYRHTGDREWLKSHAYPFLRDTAEFYRSLARKGDDGLWHIHNTNAHEDFWGVTDGVMDLAAIRGSVPLAIRAAAELAIDADLRDTWRDFLRDLAPYPMGDDPRARALTGGALADDAWAAGYLGAVDGSQNAEDVQLNPIFPFEDWTLETPDTALTTVAQRTLELAPRHQRVLGGEKTNTAFRSPIAAIRGGAATDLAAILTKYRAAFAPLANGCSLFEGATAPSVEHLGLLTMTFPEALLQSVAPRPGKPEIIRLFPAWPSAWDASFRLLARGGFLVSASMGDGRITDIEIESRRGEECRLRNPFSNPCIVRAEDGTSCARAQTAAIIAFATRSGRRYTVQAQSPGDVALPNPSIG